VLLETPDGASQLISDPFASARCFLEEERSVVQITGPGGTGKSSLAFALAKQAITRTGRFADLKHSIIPILIAREVSDVRKAVREELNKLCGMSAQIDDFMIEPLMRTKRVLLIVDALSERSQTTQITLREIHGSLVIGAMIITTRLRTEYIGISNYTVTPQSLAEPAALLGFISIYISRIVSDGGTEGVRIKDVVDGVFALVNKARDMKAVTPLLVRLFIDNSLKGKMLQPSIPDTVLNYLIRLNPQNVDVPNRVPNDVLIAGARQIALASLGTRFVPSDFDRDSVEQMWKNQDGVNAPALLERLADNGVLLRRTIAGIGHYRFVFDPLSEYLAAVELCSRLRSNRPGWAQLVEEISKVEGYPQSCDGFLVALRECVEHYRPVFQIPEIKI
jgi:hypothetical protein